MKLCRFSIIAACVAIMASCNSRGEHLDKLISDDVAGVICINMANVIEKSEIKQGDNLALPEQLASVIRENDEQLIGQMVKSIPNLGIEMKDKSYVFFPNDMMQYAVLISLSDDDKAKAHITHRTGAQFADVGGVDIVVSDMTVWCVDDDVLLMGKLRQNTDEKKIAKWLRGVLNHEGACVSDVPGAKPLLQSESEITGYFDMPRFSKLIRGNMVFNKLVADYPVLTLLVDSDVRAFTFEMAFNGNKGTITANLDMDANGVFATLLGSLLREPSADFLQAVPNTMPVVVNISVNGKALTALPQVQSMIRMVNQMPFLGNLDLNAIISSISGPVAVGVASDPYFDDEYNYVFCAQSTDPQGVVQLISSFASRLGQDPEIVDGEHIYAYANKQVRLGVIGNLVYAKMLNYEQTEPNCNTDEDMCRFFAETPFGIYSRINNAGAASVFSFGMKDASSFAGEFVTAEKGNAMLQFLNLLCSVKPVSAYDYDGGAPIVEEGSMIGEFQPL
ncbi:MAG: DUF4836 family protein [Muribaculaceae bacterium]